MAVEPSLATPVRWCNGLRIRPRAGLAGMLAACLTLAAGGCRRAAPADPCSVCDRLAACTVEKGSAICKCPPGFADVLADGSVCGDVDECGQGAFECAAGAVCENRYGSYACVCDDGFRGDGVSCQDIDECAEGLHDCDTHATCENTVGGFDCRCNIGWVGDGQGCEPAAYTDISTTYSATCAIRSDRSLWCWGTIHGGPTPFPISDDRDWIAVVRGCGLRADGSLWCWARESSVEPPFRVGTGSDWVQITRGRGIRADGSLWEWDSQDFALAQVGSDADWQVVAGSWAGAGSPGHACAIRLDGTLWCWGANEFCQAGIDNGERFIAEPMQVGSDSTWDGVVVVKYLESCAIRTDGSLWCWGYFSDRCPPELIDGEREWIAFDMAVHDCGILAGGTMRCFGYNLLGELGLGTSDYRGEGIVGSSSDWTAVSIAGEHSCGLRGDGTAWCWGDNQQAQLGDGAWIEGWVEEPTRMDDVSWRQVSAATGHTCGIQADGTLWCWGGNYNGQVGDGTRGLKSAPAQVGAFDDWTAVSTGELHSCGLRADGSTWCWGSDTFGQLGVPISQTLGGYALTPVEVPSAAGWASIDAGYVRTCGIQNDGTLWCWGAISEPVMGGPVFQPTLVVPWTDWVTASASDWEGICGIRAGGTLWCWDLYLLNEPFQLGNDADWVSVDGRNALREDGTAWVWDDTYEPRELMLGTTWKMVADLAGIRDDGTLWRWNLFDASVPPEQLGAATDWATVSPGHRYICALKSDGARWCAGNNSDGQLGDGLRWKLSPVRVLGYPEPIAP